MDVKADEPNKTDRYTLHINSLQSNRFGLRLLDAGASIQEDRR